MPDPFQTMGVEARFDLDAEALRDRHRRLSAAVHPDRFARATSTERRLALERAVAINDAFKVLSDPVRRAEALMGVHGVTCGDGNEPQPDPMLLMAIMEEGEALSEARQARDVAKLARLTASADARVSAIEARLTEGFEAAEGDAGRLAALLPTLGELRYAHRMLAQTRDAHDDVVELLEARPEGATA